MKYLRSRQRRASKKVWKEITEEVGRTLEKEKKDNFNMLNSITFNRNKNKEREGPIEFHNLDYVF